MHCMKLIHMASSLLCCCLLGNIALGSGYRAIHEFTQAEGDGVAQTLTMLNGKLYGATRIGSTFDGGSIFSVNPDGTDYTTLHAFKRPEESAAVKGGVVSLNGFLYGMAQGLGNDGTHGSVFKLRPDGTQFQEIH